MEFAAEDGSVGRAGFVVGDQSGRDGAGEHVFDNLGVFWGAEENAEGGPLVGRIEAADVDQEGGGWPARRRASATKACSGPLLSMAPRTAMVPGSGEFGTR